MLSQAHRSIVLQTISALLLGGACVGLFILLFHRSAYDFHWSAVWEYRSLLWSGYLTTVQISLASFALSLVLGALLLAFRKSGILPLVQFSMALITLIRSTPLLIQILVWYYVVFQLIGISQSLLASILILSLFHGCYIAEIFRGGVESLESHQLEIAHSLCLTRYQTYRHVIVPQVTVRTLPAAAGQLGSLVKDSSLFSVISVAELTRSAQEIAAFSFTTLEVYLVLAGVYMSLILPILGLSRYFEKRFH